MWLQSFPVEDALARGLIVVHDSAQIAPSVRIVSCEDDQTSHGPVRIEAGVIVRDNAVLFSGVVIAARVTIGCNCIVRAGVSVGPNTVVSHGVVLEKVTKVGARCRISSLTHITGAVVIEDDVQIGARVATVNDRFMQWGQHPKLIPPMFRRGCRIGSGSTILAGVEIGEHSLIGAGSVVTRSIPPRVVAYGNPAYVQGDIPILNEPMVHGERKH